MSKDIKSSVLKKKIKILYIYTKNKLNSKGKLDYFSYLTDLYWFKHKLT